MLTLANADDSHGALRYIKMTIKGIDTSDLELNATATVVQSPAGFFRAVSQLLGLCFHMFSVGSWTNTSSRSRWKVQGQ